MTAFLEVVDAVNLVKRTDPGTVTLTLDIDNVYELYGSIKTYVVGIIVPVPPVDRDPYSDDWVEWTGDNIQDHTGTGRPLGDASYFVRITASSDPSLIGLEFEF